MANLDEAYNISTKFNTKYKSINDVHKCNPIYPIYKCKICKNYMTTTNDGNQTQFCMECKYILLKNGKYVNKYVNI